ncbi:hypothetical protein [Nocardia anaemiae]|nr:hypothetical protein [Nocardia anaemiae]
MQNPTGHVTAPAAGNRDAADLLDELTIGVLVANWIPAPMNTMS